MLFLPAVLYVQRARESLLAVLSEFEICLSATTRSGPASDATSFKPYPPPFLLLKMPVGLGYDESGSLATYFALTFLSLALVPSTYWTFRSGGAPPFSFPPAPSLFWLCLTLPRLPFLNSGKTQKNVVNVIPVPEVKRKARKVKLFGKTKSKGRSVSKK